TASALEVGPSLFRRRARVQPEGGVIVTDEGVSAMEATSTSLVAVSVGLVMVSVAVVVAAEAAARNAGVAPPAAVAEFAARKAICACADAWARSRTRSRTNLWER